MMESVQPSIEADDPAAEVMVAADFVGFYEATMPTTLRRMRRVAGSDHAAWDATQEAYARVLKAWPTRRWYSAESNRRYTLTIAHHFLIDLHRRRREFPDPNAAGETGFEDRGYSVVDGMDRVQAVRAFLDRQPAIRRAVADLFFFDDYTYSEVANILQINASTVRTHVHRLRQVLRPFVESFDQTDQGGERR